MALDCSPQSCFMICLKIKLFLALAAIFCIETDFLCNSGKEHYVKSTCILKSAMHMVNVLKFQTQVVIWRQSHSLVSSNRMEKLGIEPLTPVFQFTHYTLGAPRRCVKVTDL